jgi:hypothetical protein
LGRYLIAERIIMANSLPASIFEKEFEKAKREHLAYRDVLEWTEFYFPEGDFVARVKSAQQSFAPETAIASPAEEALLEYQSSNQGGIA